jgi:hypothetical protein
MTLDLHDEESGAVRCRHGRGRFRPAQPPAGSARRRMRRAQSSWGRWPPADQGGRAPAAWRLLLSAARRASVLGGRSRRLVGRNRFSPSTLPQSRPPAAPPATGTATPHRTVNLSASRCSPSAGPHSDYLVNITAVYPVAELTAAPSTMMRAGR